MHICLYLSICLSIYIYINIYIYIYIYIWIYIYIYHNLKFRISLRSFPWWSSSYVKLEVVKCIVLVYSYFWVNILPCINIEHSCYMIYYVLIYIYIYTYIYTSTYIYIYINTYIYIYIYIYKFTTKCHSQSTSSSEWREPEPGNAFSTLCWQTNPQPWHRVLKLASLPINPKAKGIEQ